MTDKEYRFIDPVINATFRELLKDNVNKEYELFFDETSGNNPDRANEGEKKEIMATGDFEIGWPDVGFKKSDQELYQNLVKKESKTPFSRMMMSDVFIYAMALGYKDRKPVSFEKGEKRMTNMPPNAFTSEMRWLMRAISITENENLEHIVDHKIVVKNCRRNTQTEAWRLFAN